jgi:hypothetical protein
VPHPHRLVLTLLALLLGLATLGAPLPAGAAQSTVVAPPTHLRPVQSKSDCAAVLSLAAFVCDAAVRAGDLQLIWDESNKTVTGYKVYRVDRSGHTLLGAATGTARYYLVKRPSAGYTNMCFAVQADTGSHASADSSHYCYASGATATTRTFKPSHTGTYVGVAYASDQCSPSEIYKAANRDFGSAFTTFFSWLLNEKWPSQPVDGVYAGTEAVVWKNPPPCTSKTSVPGHHIQNAKMRAWAKVVFDLGTLAHSGNHKVYSAALTLEPLQTVSLASGKATLSRGQWCETWAIWVGTCCPPGPTGRGSGTSVNVVNIVQQWIWYGSTSGTEVGAFSVMPWLRYVVGPSPVFPNETYVCLTKFSTPSLQLVYF